MDLAPTIRNKLKYMEDFENPFYDLSYAQEAREEEWADGSHTTREGKTIKIKKMSDSHLTNTISYFKNAGYDTSNLEVELNKR